MQIHVQTTEYLHAVHLTMFYWKLNSSTIWGLCIPVAGLLNGRAALLWHGKAGIYIEYLLFPQPPCQRRAALWFSPWTTSLDLLQSAVTACSYRFPWMLLCFLACSLRSPWPVYILQSSMIKIWICLRICPNQDNAQEANCHFWICSM